MSGWDPKLKRLLASKDRKEAEREFDQLHRDFLGTIIDRVLTEETGRDMPDTQEKLNEETDIFDDLFVLVRGKIAIRLLNLWEEHSQHATEPKNVIGNLRGYVMSTARNACVDYLRQEYPGRHALDNSLRATLSKSHEFAMWKVVYPEGYIDWQCGRTIWLQEGTIPAPISLRENNYLLTTIRQEIEGLTPKDILHRIFEIAGHPIHYNELLELLIEFWDVERKYRQQVEGMVPFRIPKHYQRLQPDEVVEIMGTLHSMWGQVRRLAPNQAAVLLLKATPLDTGAFLDVMVDLDIVDWSILAKTLGLSVERLRIISPDLPLDDDTIADIIGVSVDDVPRIRQDARRRMKRQSERFQRKNEQLNDIDE